MTSRKALVAIGIVLVLLVVVAVVFAITPPPQFDSDTPEGTAQGYFQAIDDDDTDLAASYLSESIGANCEFDPWRPETSRVVITDVSVDGSRAVVDVRIEVSYSDSPFDGGSYDFDERVVMERTADHWLIVEPLWPMDIYACREEAG